MSDIVFGDNNNLACFNDETDGKLRFWIYNISHKAYKEYKCITNVENCEYRRVCDIVDDVIILSESYDAYYTEYKYEINHDNQTVKLELLDTDEQFEYKYDGKSDLSLVSGQTLPYTAIIYNKKMKKLYAIDDNGKHIDITNFENNKADEIFVFVIGHQRHIRPAVILYYDNLIVITIFDRANDKYFVEKVLTYSGIYILHNINNQADFANLEFEHVDSKKIHNNVFSIKIKLYDNNTLKWLHPCKTYTAYFEPDK